MRSLLFIYLFSICYWLEGQNPEIKGELKDTRDGKIYETVKIGNQEWMAENLNFATSDGSWIYDNDAANSETYGRLYKWDIARKSCPTGWHLPTADEWTALVNKIGGFGSSGGLMKKTGTEQWNNRNIGASNNSGFSALPAGYRLHDGFFRNLGDQAYFWSATEAGPYDSTAFLLYSDSESVNMVNTSKNFAFSVRCIKDLFSSPESQ